jgi:hypothetical protein
MPLAARIIMSVSDDVKMNDCPKFRSARLDCVFTPISSYSRSTPSYFRDSCVSSGHSSMRAVRSGAARPSVEPVVPMSAANVP